MRAEEDLDETENNRQSQALHLDAQLGTPSDAVIGERKMMKAMAAINRRPTLNDGESAPSGPPGLGRRSYDAAGLSRPSRSRTAVISSVGTWTPERRLNPRGAGTPRLR